MLILSVGLLALVLMPLLVLLFPLLLWFVFPTVLVLAVLGVVRVIKGHPILVPRHT